MRRACEIGRVHSEACLKRNWGSHASSCCCLSSIAVCDSVDCRAVAHDAHSRWRKLDAEVCCLCKRRRLTSTASSGPAAVLLNKSMAHDESGKGGVRGSDLTGGGAVDSGDTGEPWKNASYCSPPEGFRFPSAGLLARHNLALGSTATPSLRRNEAPVQSRFFFSARMSRKFCGRLETAHSTATADGSGFWRRRMILA
jgi:hypothetical protein